LEDILLHSGSTPDASTIGEKIKLFGDPVFLARVLRVADTLLSGF